MQFYAPLPPQGSTLQQGDLLVGVPFTYFPLRNAKVTLANTRPAKRNLVENARDVTFVAASVEFSWGIVLEFQTCDVQADPVTGFARKPILLARVRPIKDLFKNFKDGTPKEAVNNIKNLATPGRSPTVLYLPAFAEGDLTFPPSGADLLDVQRFSPQDLLDITTLLRVSLQVFGAPAFCRHFKTLCVYCFGRFGAPDDLYYSADEWAEVQRSEEERRKSQKQ